MKVGASACKVSVDRNKHQKCLRCNTKYQLTGTLPPEAVNCYKYYIEFRHLFDMVNFYTERIKENPKFPNTKCFFKNQRIEVVVYNDKDWEMKESLKEMLDYINPLKVKNIGVSRGCEAMRDVYPDIDQWNEIYTAFFKEGEEDRNKRWRETGMCLATPEGIWYKPTKCAEFTFYTGKQAEDIYKNSVKASNTLVNDL